jgi:hypothetical protein
LPDATPGAILSMRRLRKLVDQGIDTTPVFDAISSLMDSGRYKSKPSSFKRLNNSELYQVVQRAGVPSFGMLSRTESLREHHGDWSVRVSWDVTD